MEIQNPNMSYIEFTELFSTEEKCVEYFKYKRWEYGIFCPHCGNDSFYITKRGFRCKDKCCDKKFTDTSSTFFSSTKLPLKVWFWTIYLFAINKKNISSIQMGKNLGVTQKIAWEIMDVIRGVLKEDYPLILSGVVEADEGFIGKGQQWLRWGGITTRKTPILGLVERGGKVVLQCINSRNRAEIEEVIFRHVTKGATIYTDGAMAYKNLTKRYNHDYVEHSSNEYVRGNVHTNNIENVWSFLKKSIRNAHHSISGKHCQKYCDEISYRYNYRHLTSMQRFDDILSRMVRLKTIT